MLTHCYEVPRKAVLCSCSVYLVSCHSGIFFRYEYGKYWAANSKEQGLGQQFHKEEKTTS
jgi:hypothetical protein